MKAPLRETLAAAALLLSPTLAAGEDPITPLTQVAPVFREVFRKQSKDGERTLTYVRIEKPNLPALPQPPPVASRSLTPEEQAEEDIRATKEYVSTSVTATVFLNDDELITQLQWWADGKIFVAYSNVDFRYLSQVTDLETEKHIISWFPFVSSCQKRDMSHADWSAAVPKIKLSRTHSEYVVDTTEAEMKENESAFIALDAALAYYSINAETLRENYLRMQEAERLRQEELEKNPPKKPNTVIYFWPVKSRLNK